jgi:hypothetical protein
MNEEEENQQSESQYKPFSVRNLNRIVAILFVLGIYAIIFLKILFLD